MLGCGCVSRCWQQHTGDICWWSLLLMLKFGGRQGLVSQIWWCSMFPSHSRLNVCQGGYISMHRVHESVSLNSKWVRAGEHLPKASGYNMLWMLFHSGNMNLILVQAGKKTFVSSSKFIRHILKTLFSQKWRNCQCRQLWFNLWPKWNLFFFFFSKIFWNHGPFFLISIGLIQYTLLKQTFVSRNLLEQVDFYWKPTEILPLLIFVTHYISFSISIMDKDFW